MTADPAWHVELRARVGPLTRSKRLRMVRTVFEPEHRVKFERVQDDDRDHAEWILEAIVDDDPAGTLLTMDLEYTGDLWAESVLRRILDDEVAPRRAGIARGHRVGAQALNRPSPRRSSVSERPKQELSEPSSRTSPIGPAACTRPSRSSRTCVMPGGMSSTWCVTSTSGGAVGSVGEVSEGRRRAAPARRDRVGPTARRAGRGPDPSSASGPAAHAGARPMTAS